MSFSTDEFSRTQVVDSEIEKNSKYIEIMEDIHKAVSEYDYKKLSELIESTGTSDIPNQFGQTPLYLVSSDPCFHRRDLELTRFLIENGADFLYYNQENGTTPASFLFKKKDQSLIDLMLSKFEDVNEPLDLHGNTALHLAVKIANESTMVKLLEKGADPNRKNSTGIAPMHEAVSLKCHLLQTLLNYGGDINLEGPNGRTPIHLAVVSCNRLIINYVLTLCPNVNIKDNDRNTALALLIKNPNLPLNNLIRKFIRAGADLTLTDQHGLNVLHRLVHSNRFNSQLEELITEVINWGVDLDAKTSGEQNTALHLAANTSSRSSKDLVHLLLSKGANLLAKNIRGRRPLDYAVFGQNIDIIEMMFSFAVRKNCPENDLMMAYHRTTDFYSSISKLHNLCQNEYRKAEELKVTSSFGLNIKNVLLMDDVKLAKVLKNKNASSEISSNFKNFQAFRFSLMKAYENAWRIRTAEDNAINFLYTELNYKLPVLCIEMIVSNFKKEHLKVFLGSKKNF
ncbi:serine/threonine-protein phosphatase 6 regulatory ankyrin repeat subunit C-like [Harmonia axyridis]|uniref:serine/threonine-protein phosphatase 6 regulatory ankyrin repeat subunit C-like n=1 Tax=Harmonia axyridis TaxID=115357 RepID=UPI001E279B34|nr:serine/threonine-protein phosphatase 6 regulatory ankyrin repeat subunit C-like [Harmonia axyridis]XP_045467900.1 serine/threonine-protein phosphatase 6 regulatory ankyrin repeat subunit C-like [Harmonia axyridis]